MTTNPHRVTAQHVHGLAAADRMRGGRTILADTEDGLRYVAAGTVLTEGSKVRRLLLTREDLVEDADRSGLSLPAFLRANAARMAAELNAVLRRTPNDRLHQHHPNRL